MIWAGLSAGLAAFMSAATPATCGVAMLVPLITLYWFPGHVD